MGEHILGRFLVGVVPGVGLPKRADPQAPGGCKPGNLLDFEQTDG